LVAALTTGTEVVVQARETGEPVCDGATLKALLAWHGQAREELGEGAEELEFDAAAAGWALGQFYRAAQLLVCRDVTAEEAVRMLGVTGPATRGAAADFSVDLVFRFLPELYERARRLAPEDALVGELEKWARAWPLSSVGVALAETPPLETFWENAALRRLYVDRVTERRAEDRWRDARVAVQVRADLGAWPELAPGVAEALRRAETISQNQSTFSPPP
jgi:hypothetical protein